MADQTISESFPSFAAAAQAAARQKRKDGKHRVPVPCKDDATRYRLVEHSGAPHSATK